MSLLKIQKQSPWTVLWKGLPKNHPKFTGTYRLEVCNFIKKTLTRAYFGHLFRAASVNNALFQFLRAFSHSRNLELACCFWGVSSVNLARLIHTARMPCRHRCFLENYAKFLGTPILWKNYKQLLRKKLSYICSFN